MILGDADTRVLLALCRVYLRDHRAIVRVVAAEAGLSLSSTYEHLRHLEELGLIDSGRPMIGALRPLVRELRRSRVGFA